MRVSLRGVTSSGVGPSLRVPRHSSRSSRLSPPLNRNSSVTAIRPLRTLLGGLFGLGAGGDANMPDVPLKKTESEWKELLSSEEYYVLRQKGTERPGVGEYDSFYPTEGYFTCRACDNPLYSAESKFKSGCGWPAFDKCYKGGVIVEVDNTMGMRRVEIMCGNCGGHLGHVFENEGFTPTMERHCVNSISVKYNEGEPPSGLEEAKVV
ncbi:peptide methionine sulfoxide reductase [Pycnococcus provasolii]